MIRSTKHYFQDLNSGKAEIIRSFLIAYNLAVQFYTDYIWNAEFYHHKTGELQFSIEQEILNPPFFIDYKVIEQQTTFSSLLSGRALSAAANQAVSVVKGAVAFRSKLLWIIAKRKSEGLSTEYWEKKLEKHPLRKPNLNPLNAVAELSSKSIDFKEVDGHFNLFVRLAATGFPHIKIPIQFHKQDKKWLGRDGKRLAGVLIKHNHIQLRFEVPEPEKKTEGIVVGADTGFKTVATFSNGETTPQQDTHGHSLESICKKLANKQKNSKSFEKTQKHRENFIKWSINQLNLSDIKEIKLEEVKNIFAGRKTSRLMSGWTNSIIEAKIISLAEEEGVLVSLQPSTYKSQRCSRCGLVRKANRKKKEYNCSNCGLQVDADLNGAINNEANIPAVPYALRRLELNRGEGFFWKENGFFLLNGEELRVPHADKKLNI